MIDKLSRPLGAVRLKEHFLKRDPAKGRELREMKEYIDDKLAVAIRRLPAESIHRVIATSGTAGAVVRAVNRLRRSESDYADGLGVSARQVKSFFKKLSVLDLAGRRAIRGIGARRAEVIVPGVAVLHRILVAFRQPVLTYSTAGVRDGIIATLAMLDHERRPAHEEHFQVFLCHNSPDKAAVREIAQRLRDRGVVPWLDEEQIQP